MTTLNRLVGLTVGKPDEREQVADVIERVVRVERELACDIRSMLIAIDSSYDEPARLEPRALSGDSWEYVWRDFVESVKTKKRYSFEALRTLEGLFDGIGSMCTSDGQSIIVDAGPGTELVAFYRARVFQSNEQLEFALTQPDRALGPPPSGSAKPGRMNPSGISVFYGTTDPEVAMAEVRPPVGSQVAIARFVTLRPLRILDLTGLGGVVHQGSLFDPSSVERTTRAAFLQSLAKQITRPVLPEDEAMDYLPTQIIADFLANEVEGLDGVLFASVQAGGGRNVTLFNKASHVEPLDIAADVRLVAEVKRFGTDDPDPKYNVLEWRESDWEVDGETTVASGRTECPVASFEHSDSREPTLRIDRDAISVGVVRSVQVNADTVDVEWLRADED